MRRVLLVLPSTTYRAADFLAAAARLGVEVIVASEHRQALTERALVVSLGDAPRAARAIAREAPPLDAIVAVDDEGVRAAAAAAARLGLRGNPPEAVARTRDKEAMRDAFASAGVPQPSYRVARPGDDVAELACEVGVPCVVKPVSLSASRGVIRADTGTAAAAAAERARAIAADPDARLLVERFVGGPEVAVEGLLEDGRLRVLAVFDKPDPLDGPYFEETIYVTPSRLRTETLTRVEAATAAAAAALGLRDGPLHAELRAGPELAVIELAARSIGGLCSRVLRFGLGMSLEELILRHALSLPIDGATREEQAAGVMMLPVEQRGRLVEVTGQAAARAVPGIAGLELSVVPGRELRPLPEGDRYLGFLFAKADHPEAVEAALRTAYSRLRLVTEEQACVSS